MGNRAERIKSQIQMIVDSLNTTDLCIEWNLSTKKMEEAKTTDDQLSVAQVRDFLLAAFEKRDPKAYRAWFEDEDSSDDPSKFFDCSEPSKFKDAARYAKAVAV